MISVLYVDDEAGLLEIGKLFLERIGTITVDIVNSARDALNRLASTAYDVIVSDYQMPGMDGIEFLQNIRVSSDIPFILFTSRSREEVAITALDSGADYYVQKGGNPNAQFAELSHDIHQIVKHKTIEAELRREQEFSRALLEDLVIGPEDLYRMEILPSPVLESDRPSSRSPEGKTSAGSITREWSKAEPSGIRKTDTHHPRFAELFGSLNQMVKGRGVKAGMSEAHPYPNTLLEDLVTGPEDLYRTRVLPCPVRAPALRFRHSGSY